MGPRRYSVPWPLDNREHAPSDFNRPWPTAEGYTHTQLQEHSGARLPQTLEAPVLCAFTVHVRLANKSLRCVLGTFKTTADYSVPGCLGSAVDALKTVFVPYSHFLSLLQMQALDLSKSMFEGACSRGDRPQELGFRAEHEPFTLQNKFQLLLL